MKEVSKTGHFKIDLPSSDAATALSGPGNSFLKKFESLTGVSLTIRGLQLEMNGVISKIERASALDLPLDLLSLVPKLVLLVLPMLRLSQF